MAAKKKPGFIPEVDVLKSGINKDKPYDINDDGRVRISRKKKINDIIEKNTVNEYLEKEKELKLIQDKLDELKLDKSDIKGLKGDIKKSKKKSKKKKKNKDKNSYANNMLNAIPDDLAAYIKDGGIKGEKKKKKKEKEKKKNRSKIAGLKVKEKRKPTKGKSIKIDKGKSEVAERFKEVEKITRDNIKEIDNTMLVVDERIKEITKTSERIRGKDRALADYITAKTSLISSRQRAATDILTNRAKIYDIEMKKEKDKASAGLNDNDLIARIFPGIALNSSVSKEVNDYISKSGKNKDGKKKKKRDKKYKDFYDDHEDSFLKREKELLHSGDIKYSKYDQNIEYEGKFNVAIKKSFQTGDWKFVAVDDNNKFIDIPKSMLPSKKIVSMKFDDEKDVALDVNSNRMYKVFNVPLI